VAFRLVTLWSCQFRIDLLSKFVFKGAGRLGPHLESVYGENGFAMIVDEGCKSANSYRSYTR
jgi:hypothetical protein